MGGAKNPFKCPTEVMRPQSRGMGVKWLQFELNDRGYLVDIDGIFGPQTEGAVKEFQRAKGLTVDGIVRRDTRTEFLTKG